MPERKYKKRASKSADTLSVQVGLFLEQLALDGNVSRSCDVSGLTTQKVYGMRKENPEFAALWTEALVLGNAALEDEARRRAVRGISRNVYYQGNVVGTEMVYSDQLLTFLMQGHLANYRQKQSIEMNVSGSLNVKKKVQFYLPSNGRDDKAVEPEPDPKGKAS